MLSKKFLRKNHILRLLGTLAMSVMIAGGTASAATDLVPDLDPAQKGTLSVNLAYQEEAEDGSIVDMPVDGASLLLYKVADLTVENGSANYALTADFASTGVKFEGMTASQSNEAAAAMASISGVNPGASGVTDEKGNVTFTDLPFGMYMVCENKSAGTGTALETSTMSPFLVMVPGINRGEDSNSWIYQVSTYPKIPPKKNPVTGDGTIKVTKKLYDLNEIEVTCTKGTFYAAVFDENQKRVSDVLPIHFENQKSSTVEFKGLALDRTYYVLETDANGAPIPENMNLSGLPYAPEYPNGQTVQLTVSKKTANQNIYNVFPELPEDYYYEADLTITKKTLKGTQEYKTDKVFYAAVFTDKKLTSGSRVGDILVLDMKGGSNVSVTQKLGLGKDPNATVTFYVAETDKNGTPLDNASLTEFKYEISNDGKVSMTAKENKAKVVITNTFPTTPPGEDSTTTTTTTPPGGGNSNNPGGGNVKTGDETPLTMMAIVLAASALLIVLLVSRKVKRSR